MQPSTRVQYDIHILARDLWVILEFCFQATVMKKKMYYHMRVKTVRRNLTNLVNRLNKEKKILLQLPEDKLKSLCFSLKSVRFYV